MRCDDFQELLPWLLNGTLEESEAREVREHLKECAVCRAELAATHFAGRVFSAHVGAEDLTSYAFDRPTTLDRGRIAAHLAACDRCAGELELVAESRRLSEEDGGTGAAEPARGARVVPFARPAPGRAEAPPAAGFWRWAAVAASLTALVAFGGWMASWTGARSLGERLAAERRAAEATVEQVAGLERQTRELTEQSAQAQEQIASLESELAARPTAGGAPAPARPELLLNTPVIDLFAGDVVVRGGSSSAPARTKLPAGAGLVTLILNLDDRESFDDYELRVLDAAGATVRTERGLRRDPESHNFTISLPTSLLGRGEASLVVYGLRGGKATRLASYPVTVGK